MLQQNHCQTMGFKKKKWPTKLPLVEGRGGGKPYPASGLIILIFCHNQELWVEMLT